jgi:hypothetical protein
MRIRIFGYYWQLGLVLLWVFESTVIFGSSVLAFRWLGAESPAVMWAQSAVLACSVAACVTRPPGSCCVSG